MSSDPKTDGRDACFACDGASADLAADGPSRWIEPRAACGRHVESAALATGEPLVDFVRRAGDDPPFEGGHLSLVVNPAWVEGRKAWVSLLAGFVVVREEIFPSRGWFDYCAQHTPGLVDAIYALHGNRGRFDPSDPLQVVRSFEGDGRLMRSFDDLERLWRYQGEVDRELEARGRLRVESPAEALEVAGVVGRAPSTYVSDGAFRSFVASLLDLAPARFAHLGEREM